MSHMNMHEAHGGGTHKTWAPVKRQQVAPTLFRDSDKNPLFSGTFCRPGGIDGGNPWSRWFWLRFGVFQFVLVSVCVCGLLRFRAVSGAGYSGFFQVSKTVLHVSVYLFIF